MHEIIAHTTHQRTADFISVIDITTGADSVAEWMNKLEKSPIGIAPWGSAFPYLPEVSFAIAHSPHHLLLKYFVTEKHVRALYQEVNDPVHKDSCVEFFIAFDESAYYNLEFNCVGTCQAAFGAGKNGRVMIDKNIIRKIRWHVLLETASRHDDRIRWELTLMIPFEVFCFHNLITLKGVSCRANFYKCGDDLPEPHFLTWNNISAGEPDFHQPEYFGSIYFQNPETDPNKLKQPDL